MTENGGLQQCLVRTQTVANLSISHCQDFDPLKDDCLSCKEGYYLITEPNSTLKRCQINPNNCWIYNYVPNPGVSYCSACINGYTLIIVNAVPICVEKNQLIQALSPAPTFYPGYI